MKQTKTHLFNPRFSIGETVIVHFKEDKTIRYIGKILSGTNVDNDGWKYTILIDALENYKVWYDELEITKIRNVHDF